MAWTEEEMKIAEQMLEQYNKHQRLSQTAAVLYIRKNFDELHTYKNKQHNWAINKGILDAFRQLTPDSVVWSRSRQMWRARKPNDPIETRMVR